MKSRYVCARCGNAVHLWFYGWKHAAGWHSKTPSCDKPQPIERLKP